MAHVAQTVLGNRGLADAGPQGSILAGIDPRARILAAAAFAVVVVSLHHLAALGCALLLSFAALALARLAPGPTLKRMATMDGFIIFMLVLLPFTVPGEPLFTLFGFPASMQGLMQAVEIALKANAVVLMLLSLVGSMEPVMLGHALHRLRVPQGLVHLLLFTVRYVDVLREENARLRAAMKARGFRPGSNWHSYRTFGYLMGMMLVRAIERSERILGAMRCRGFNGRIPLLENLAFTRRDTVFAFICAAALAGLVALAVLA